MDTNIRTLISKLPSHEQGKVLERLTKIIKKRDKVELKESTRKLKKSVYKDLRPIFSKITNTTNELRELTIEGDVRLAEDWKRTIANTTETLQKQITQLDETIKKDTTRSDLETSIKTTEDKTDKGFIKVAETLGHLSTELSTLHSELETNKSRLVGVEEDDSVQLLDTRLAKLSTRLSTIESATQGVQTKLIELAALEDTGLTLEDITPVVIRDKLHSLRGKERLDAFAIQNLDKYVKTTVIAHGSGIGALRDELDKGYLDNKYINEGQTAGGDLGGTYPNPTVDFIQNIIINTKDIILGTTPATKTFALATDTGYYYFFDGTNWQESGVKFNVRSNKDIGTSQDASLEGYNTDYFNAKTMYNVVLAGHPNNPVNGSLQVNVASDPDTVEIFLRNAWQTIIYDLTYSYGDFRHTPIGEQIKVWSGNAVSVGANGRPIVQEYEVDIGANPAPRVINCGEF